MEKLTVARAKTQPETVGDIGKQVAFLADILVKEIRFVVAGHLTENTEKDRKRSEPLLAIDNLCLGESRGLYENDTAEEIRWYFIKVNIILHRCQEVIKQFGSLLSGPSVRTLVWGDLEEIVVAEDAPQLFLFGFECLAHCQYPTTCPSLRTSVPPCSMPVSGWIMMAW